MLFATIVIGGFLLLFGRKLFWLSVGACGFATGLALTTRMFSGRPEWLAVLIGVGAGVLGALIAVIFQRLAIGVGGCLAGAFIAVSMAGRLNLEEGVGFWGMLVLGGVVGALLVVALFEWGLIALSCLCGASLIVGALRLPETSAVVAWLGLLVLGVAGQAAMLRHDRGSPARKARARDGS